MKKDYKSPEADALYKGLLDDQASFPFSFSLGGDAVSGFGSLTEVGREKQTDGCREAVKIRYRADDCLDVTLIMTHYYSHGATEWTVWFENNGKDNSPMISDVKTVLNFEGANPVLKGIMGDHVNQYRPYSHDLQDGMIDFSSTTGRATHITFPYFNLEYGSGGALLAIGWAGTWRAQFSFDGQKTTYTASSVNNLCTYLKPGERIRTALFVRLPYSVRRESYATNLWRSWFIECNMPKADKDGTPLTPFSTCWLACDSGFPNSDGSISETHATYKKSLDRLIKEGVRPDFRWLDAGWYVCADGRSAEPFVRGHDWWDTVGTWEPDPVKWPGDSLLQATEYCRENGMKTLVWFEPERVTFLDDLVKNYGYKKEWGIYFDGDHPELRDQNDPGYRILISNNIGDPECFRWTTDRICKTLRENKIEMYREDNNCNAALLWKYLDEKEGDGRLGITECKFIDGHYRMWDEIIACTSSYGGCSFVDSCASGGGRNDLESMRRGIPLLRSDSDRTSSSLRLSMTHSFNKWIPFCGASTKESMRELEDGVQDAYIWRASYLPALNLVGQFTTDPNFDFENFRFGNDEWRSIAPYLLADFYPLTPWHSEKDTTSFSAFCYFDSERNEGVILAFRQEECRESTLTVNMPFLNGEMYTIVDKDTGKSFETSGRAEFRFDAPRTSKLLWVKKK